MRVFYIGAGIMRYIYIITISLILASCGPSSEEKKNIAAVTCSIMGETRNMDAAVRVREMNNAREQIGGEPFLGGDDAIKEAFEYGLCEELVLGTYDEALNSMREEARLAWEAGAEGRKIAEKIAEEKQRISDTKPSVKEEFHSNGKLKRRTNYQSKNDGGKKQGLSESYYENGQLESKINWKDGERHGIQESYYENGQLERKFNWKDDRAYGLEEVYHENGQFKSKINWKDSKKQGIQEIYRENGQLERKNNWKDGERHGMQENYYENGQLSSRQNYKDGKKDGLWALYDENGSEAAFCVKNGAIIDDSYCKPQ